MAGRKPFRSLDAPLASQGGSHEDGGEGVNGAEIVKCCTYSLATFCGGWKPKRQQTTCRVHNSADM